MSAQPIISKRKPRTGIEQLFNEQGKLTEEALYICKISGVDPKNLYARSFDSFLKKHQNKEAEKMAQQYEQQRSDYLQMVLTQMKQAQTAGRRSIQSKSMKVLNNLSVSPEERKLRTAYKNNAYNDMNQDAIANSSFYKRNTGSQIMAMSTNTDAARAYDLLPGISSAARPRNQSAFQSPERDSSFERQLKTQSKWELVCVRKEQMILDKQMHIKDLMHKEFKSEKKRMQVNDERVEGRLWDMQKKADRASQLEQKKKAIEDTLQKKRNLTFQLSNQKAKQAIERRDLAVSQNKTGRLSRKNSEIGSMDALVDPFAKRNYSTMGGSMQNLRSNIDNDELEVASKIYAYEQKMQRAQDMKLEKQRQKQASALSLNSIIHEKLEKRKQLETEYSQQLFEKNTLKRTQWEKKNKKAKDEDFFYKGFEKDKKEEKLKGIKIRQEDIDKNRLKKQGEIEKRVVGSRNKSQAQIVMTENRAVQIEMNQRRKQIQQLNLQRRKNQQNEYKSVLVDSMYQKDLKKTLINQRRQANQENFERLNIQIQSQVHNTAATASSVANPVPFEQYKKEFDAIKAPKKKVNPDD